MHVEFIVEEPSAEVVLSKIVPRILVEGVTYKIHTHGGKKDLLSSLSGRLRGYKHWLPGDWRIVVLIDEDRQNCRDIKTKLEEFASDADLITKSSVEECRLFQVLNRVAIEELEAWFFGDINAIVTAYPGVPVSLGKKAKFRNPDAIKGGTWEALEGVLQKAGHHKGGLAKIKAARDISEYMNPDQNSSKSFQVFRDGLKCLCQTTLDVSEQGDN